MRTILSFAFVALALSAAGCSNDMDSMAYQVVPSTGIATSDLEGSFMVSGEQGKDTVQASAFFANQRTSDGVDLAGNDEVFCDGVKLEGTFGARYAVLRRKVAGERYVFELRRSGESVSVSIAAIEPVKLASPTAAAELRLNERLNLSWQAAPGTAIDALLMGGCVVSDAKSEVDTGAIALDVRRAPEVPDNGKGQSTPGFDPGNPDGKKSCVGDATLSIVRKQPGTETTALAATKTLAEETHRIPVHVTP